MAPKLEFNIHQHQVLNNLCLIIFLICASLSLILWSAPLSYRLTSLSVLGFSSLWLYYKNKSNTNKNYQLIYKNETWHLKNENQKEQAVTILRSSILSRYYIALHLKTLFKKKYYLIITKRNCTNKKTYHELIRSLKTHRGSF